MPSVCQTGVVVVESGRGFRNVVHRGSQRPLRASDDAHRLTRLPYRFDEELEARRDDAVSRHGYREVPRSGGGHRHRAISALPGAARLEDGTDGVARQLHCEHEGRLIDRGIRRVEMPGRRHVRLVALPR